MNLDREQKELFMEPIQSTREEQGPNWATSYSDLVTLLLVFFVLLVSASKISTSKFEMIQNSFQGETQKTTSIEELLETLQVVFEKHQLSDFVSAVPDEDGVMVIIKDNLLFKSGEAEIASNSRELFQPVLHAFEDLPTYYRFYIEGHTDDVPIKNESFQSNWELSSARAISVLNLFTEQQFQKNAYPSTDLRINAHWHPIEIKKGRSFPRTGKRTAVW